MGLMAWDNTERKTPDAQIIENVYAEQSASVVARFNLLLEIRLCSNTT